MSAVQEFQKAAAPAKAPRKLELARHYRGADAIGWVLLGFVLGAGAAMAVLLNANFGARKPDVAANQGPSVRLELSPAAPAPPPIVVSAPAALPPQVSTVQPAPEAAPAVVQAAPKPALAAASPARAARKPPSGVPEAVAQDAAAAGLTSRSEGGDSGLY